MFKYITQEEVFKILTDLNDPLNAKVRTTEAMRLINDLPAADVKPVVRGKWIELGKYIDGYNWRCSVCKRESTMAINYCPNCGADMRGNIKNV